MQILGLLTLLMLSGCATSPSRLFDQIAQCGQDETEAAFRTKCAREFEGSEFTVQVESVKNLGVIYLTLFGEMGDPNKMINCNLRGQDRDRAEKLQAGDRVRLKATPSRVSMGEVSFIHFEECELR